jgi:vitamin B12 transporter
MSGYRIQWIIYNIIIVCYLLFFCVSVVLAEEIQEESFALERIIISAKRFPAGLNEVAENATIITAEEIEKLPARNLGEVLSYLPGVDIEPRSSFGQLTAITIQGSNSRHVRVMIDGIPLNTQASGQVNHFNFPIENIQRIEIIKGASCSVWGSALGGIINVITKDTGDTPVPKGSITQSSAEYSTVKESFDLSGEAGNLGYYLSSSYMESDGIRAKADTEQINAFNKICFPWGDLAKITSSFGYIQGDVNTGQLPDGTYQHTPYSNKYGRIGLDVDFDNGVIFNNAFKFSCQELTTKYFATIEDEEPYFIVRTQDQYYGLEFKSLVNLRDEDTFLLGADFDWHILKSTYLTDSKSINLQAPYFNYTIKLNKWDWIFGARFDNNSEFGSQFSPSLGVVYQIPTLSDTSIRATVSRAFNAPPLLWKFYEEIISGITVNPDIKPEKAWVYELGVESRLLDNLWIGLSLYRADVKDAIARITEGGKDYMKNFQRFRRLGAEIQIKTELNSSLTLSNTAAFNDVENRETKETVRGIGVARQSFGTGIEYKNESGFGFLLRAYYNRWNQVASAEPNDRKVICDVRISQEIKHIKGLDIILFLNIYNLTNSAYWADNYFPIPLRYFEGGFTLKW